MVAGLLFSIVVTFELIEQPYELLDAELKSQAETLLAGLSPVAGKLTRSSDDPMLESIGKLYWFKVYDRQKKPVFSSAMTRFVDLPLKNRSKGYNFNADIRPDAANLDEDDGTDMTFRVRVFNLPFRGYSYLVQIARPMEKLEEEVTDLAIAIPAGLVVFALALVGLGYFAAGKILQPIAAINALAREITDKTLDKRIPTGKNRDEIYDLVTSLNRMFDRLQYSFERQKEFIANASHELKTPLAMQRLFFDEAWMRDDLPGDFQQQVSVQVKNCYRMDRLVRDLLDLSALELKDSFEPEDVDFSDLVSGVFCDFKEIIAAAEISLVRDIQPGIHLQGDREKLRRVLINIVDNAVKYTVGDEPEIRCTVFREEGTVHIELFNTCEGIPSEDMDRIFNQFYRVEKSRATDLGGSGLGLTIVKRIIDLHGGKIVVKNGNSGGVNVYIKLPAGEKTGKGVNDAG